jgi:hypothetical protein
MILVLSFTFVDTNTYVITAMISLRNIRPINPYKRGNEAFRNIFYGVEAFFLLECVFFVDTAKEYVENKRKITTTTQQK